jgi:hypothetical protein
VTLRSLGAATLLAVFGALLARTLRSSLLEELQHLADDSFAIPDLGFFEEAQRAQIKRAYAAASRAVFIWSFVSIVVSLALATIIRDCRLSQKEEEATAQNQVSEMEGEEVRLEQGSRDTKEERVKQRS